MGTIMLQRFGDYMTTGTHVEILIKWLIALLVITALASGVGAVPLVELLMTIFAWLLAILGLRLVLSPVWPLGNEPKGGKKAAPKKKDDHGHGHHDHGHH